jgi:D-arginine dehydrogenase
VDLELDVAVIGGGIAGVSAAGELSGEPGLRVALFERESQLAYHTSGRSAATFLESYGSPEIRALTRSSRDTLERANLLERRPALWLAPEHDVAALRALLDVEPTLREVSREEASALCEAIRPGWSALSAVEDGAADLDVAGLLEHYRRLAVTGGVTVHTGVSLVDGKWDGGQWVLHTNRGTIRAGAVVNAAGAWADDVALRCGVATVGLRPLRRTIAVVRAPTVRRDWPMVSDLHDQFYFRPEGDALLISPADETPSEPVDARPLDEDVALGIERVNEATTLNVRHVRTAWAGLRTFAPDRNPVVGFGAESFFWLAGQGGYGMQTAPAMAALAAALVRGKDAPAGLHDAARALAPTRFTRTED